MEKDYDTRRVMEQVFFSIYSGLISHPTSDNTSNSFYQNSCITKEFLNNWTIVLSFKLVPIRKKWVHFFGISCLKALSSYDMYLRYIIFACNYAIEKSSNVFDRLLCTCAIVINFNYEILTNTGLNLCELSVDTFMVVYESALMEDFHFHGGFESFAEFLHREWNAIESFIKKNQNVCEAYTYALKAFSSKKGYVYFGEELEKEPYRPEFITHDEIINNSDCASLAKKVLSNTKINLPTLPNITDLKKIIRIVRQERAEISEMRSRADERDNTTKPDFELNMTRADLEYETTEAVLKSKTAGTDSKSNAVRKDSESKTKRLDQESSLSMGADSESKTTEANSESKSTETNSEIKTTGADSEIKTTGADSGIKTTGADSEIKTTGADSESKTTGEDNKCKTTVANSKSKANANSKARAADFENQTMKTNFEPNTTKSDLDSECKRTKLDSDNKTIELDSNYKMIGADTECKTTKLASERERTAADSKWEKTGANSKHKTTAIVLKRCQAQPVSLANNMIYQKANIPWCSNVVRKVVGYNNSRCTNTVGKNNRFQEAYKILEHIQDNIKSLNDVLEDYDDD